MTSPVSCTFVSSSHLPVCSLATQGDNPLTGIPEIDLSQIDFNSDFDTHYGLVAPSQTVLVRAYSDDTDEQMLSEIQPRYIIMYEPNLDFVRRIEVR